MFLDEFSLRSPTGSEVSRAEWFGETCPEPVLVVHGLANRGNGLERVPGYADPEAVVIAAMQYPQLRLAALKAIGELAAKELSESSDS